MYKIFKRTISFTLAETLIVIGIIGVIAALTLPNLNQSTGNKENVAKVKKIYQNLNDALGRAEAVYGPVGTWCNNFAGSCENRHIERLTEFMQTSKVCNSVSVCSVTLDAGSGGWSYSKSAILADGTLFAISYTSTHVNMLLVDIDGTKKGKNQPGRDVFKFYYENNKGVYVTNAKENHWGSNYSYVALSNNNYLAGDAAWWVINFDNMDYLKTSDGTSCKNGTKLTFDGNHSCN